MAPAGVFIEDHQDSYHAVIAARQAATPDIGGNDSGTDDAMSSPSTLTQKSIQARRFNPRSGTRSPQQQRILKASRGRSVSPSRAGSSKSVASHSRTLTAHSTSHLNTSAAKTSVASNRRPPPVRTTFQPMDLLSQMPASAPARPRPAPYEIPPRNSLTARSSNSPNSIRRRTAASASSVYQEDLAQLEAPRTMHSPSVAPPTPDQQALPATQATAQSGLDLTAQQSVPSVAMSSSTQELGNEVQMDAVNAVTMHQEEMQLLSPQANQELDQQYPPVSPRYIPQSPLFRGAQESRDHLQTQSIDHNSTMRILDNTSMTSMDAPLQRQNLGPIGTPMSNGGIPLANIHDYNTINQIGAHNQVSNTMQFPMLQSTLNWNQSNRAAATNPRQGTSLLPGMTSQQAPPTVIDLASPFRHTSVQPRMQHITHHQQRHTSNPPEYAQAMLNNGPHHGLDQSILRIGNASAAPADNFQTTLINPATMNIDQHPRLDQVSTSAPAIQGGGVSNEVSQTAPTGSTHVPQNNVPSSGEVEASNVNAPFSLYSREADELISDNGIVVNQDEQAATPIGERTARTRSIYPSTILEADIPSTTASNGAEVAQNAVRYSVEPFPRSVNEIDETMQFFLEHIFSLGLNVGDVQTWLIQRSSNSIDIVCTNADASRRLEELLPEATIDTPTAGVVRNFTWRRNGPRHPPEVFAFHLDQVAHNGTILNAISDNQLAAITLEFARITRATDVRGMWRHLFPTPQRDQDGNFVTLPRNEVTLCVEISVEDREALPGWFKVASPSILFKVIHVDRRDYCELCRNHTVHETGEVCPRRRCFQCNVLGHLIIDCPRRSRSFRGGFQGIRGGFQGNRGGFRGNRGGFATARRY